MGYHEDGACTSVLTIRRYLLDTLFLFITIERMGVEDDNIGGAPKAEEADDERPSAEDTSPEQVTDYLRELTRLADLEERLTDDSDDPADEVLAIDAPPFDDETIARIMKKVRIPLFEVEIVSFNSNNEEVGIDPLENPP